MKNMQGIFKAIFPELNGYHYPIRARVTAVHEAGGTVGDFNKIYSIDVQPLKPDGSVDDMQPVIPDVELPVLWAGPQRGIYCLPVIGAIVRLAYYYNDPAQPFIDAVLADGYDAPDHPVGALIIQQVAGVKIEITRDGQINIKTGKKITMAGGPEIDLSAQRIHLDAQRIGFTAKDGGHPIAYADVVKAVFDGHTHSTPHGESGPPSQAMSGHASGTSYTG